MPTTIRRRSDPLEGYSVDILRNLFRWLDEWRSQIEDGGITDLTYYAGPSIMGDGFEYHIIDVEDLYAASQRHLSPRQAQAIKWFLVENFSESEVAEMMGIKPTNPIGMYATSGLQLLIEMIDNREI